MTKDSSAKRKAGKRKPEKLSFTQDFIPIKNLEHSIIETTDGRYIKILEIEPINFMLRSEEEQYEIICSFASWLKISPVHLQFKSTPAKLTPISTLPCSERRWRPRKVSSVKSSVRDISDSSRMWEAVKR